MIHERPKNEIFASDAKDGEIVEFPNVKRGWGVTENLGFIPPMEYFNAAFNRVDKALAYQSQRGVSEWSADEEYPIGALSVFGGKLYQAKTQNTNKKPSENKDVWAVMDAYNKQESDERYAKKSDVTDGVKIGSYLLWSSQSVTPAGFLVCDGRSLKKREYAELFTVVGYTYGGSGENFNIPNFADGKFMRSVGGNAAPLGKAQGDAIRNITGRFSRGFKGDANSLTGPFAMSSTQSSSSGGSGYDRHLIDFDVSRTVPTANENRPYNTAVVVLIKAKEVKEPSANQIDKSIYATETKAGITKLKNSITGKAEDVAVTEKAVSDAIEINKSIGVGQTWQDVKDQRQAGVTYTNTTGRPIMVCIQATMNIGAATCPIFVDGIKVGEVWEHHAVNKADHITFIVPNGSTYKADLTIGINGIYVWSELR